MYKFGFVCVFQLMLSYQLDKSFCVFRLYCHEEQLITSSNLSFFKTSSNKEIVQLVGKRYDARNKNGCNTFQDS